MSRDRSLEEFLDGTTSDGSDSDERGDAGDGAPGTGGASDTSSDVRDPGAVDPLVSTYRWSPDGNVCRNCGDPDRARWRAEDGFVCETCKEW